VLAQLDRWTVRAEALAEVGGVEDGLLLAAAAMATSAILDSISGAQLLAEPSLARVAIAETHRALPSSPATTVGFRIGGIRRRKMVVAQEAVRWVRDLVRPNLDPLSPC